MFFQMLEVAKDSTKKEFKEKFQGSSLEKPGNLEKAVCSRLKFAKEKTINETGQPDVPASLIDKVERFDEANDRVRTKRYPRCWRCQERCRFCLIKKTKPMAPLGSELMSPFLSSMDEIADEMGWSDSSDDEARNTNMPDGLEKIPDDESEELMERFFDEDISDDDEDSEDEDMSEEDEDA